MTNPEPTASVGTRLREAREKRGVALRQVADRTRISVMALEAIERDDIKRLPGGIFTRAFLRSYAVEVGLSPDRIVEDFLAQFPQEPNFVVGPGGHVEDNEAVESERRVAETVVRLLLLSLPIAGAAMYFTMRTPPAPAASLQPPAIARTVSSDDAAAATEAGEETGEETGAGVRTGVTSVAQGGATANLLRMVIDPSTDCWVSPTIDGEKVPSGLLARGERRELRALREILVTFGNGGGCAYTLNGQAGRPLGNAGQVVTRRITLENYRTYLASSEE
jgi:cytoskeletal protein RodZ